MSKMLKCEKGHRTKHLFMYYKLEHCLYRKIYCKIVSTKFVELKRFYKNPYMSPRGDIYGDNFVSFFRFRIRLKRFNLNKTVLYNADLTDSYQVITIKRIERKIVISISMVKNVTFSRV